MDGCKEGLRIADSNQKLLARRPQFQGSMNSAFTTYYVRQTTFPTQKVVRNVVNLM